MKRPLAYITAHWGDNEFENTENAPLAYITAHWGDNEFENTENAAKYCRLVYEAGFSPICPLLFLPLFLKDSISVPSAVFEGQHPPGA